jgi:hypothetical protein
LVLVVVAGCGHPKPVAGPAPNMTSGHIVADAGLPSGWTRVQSDSGEVSIGLAPGWSEHDISLTKVAANQQPGWDKNPAAVKALAEDNDFKLLFTHPKGPLQPFTASGNVTVTFVVGALSLDQRFLVARTSIKDDKATNLKAFDVDLPAGHAKVLDYQMVTKSRSGVSYNVQHRKYYLLANHQVYSIGFSVAPGNGELMDECASMAKTFKIEKH